MTEPVGVGSWPTVLIALINNLPQILTAIAAVVGAVYAIKSKLQGEVVAKHVNGAASVSVAKIESLEREVRRSAFELAERKQAAALMAQSAAIAAGATTAVTVGVVEPPPSKELSEIVARIETLLQEHHRIATGFLETHATASDPNTIPAIAVKTEPL